MAIAIRGTTPGIATSTGSPSLVLNGARQPNAGDVLIIIHCNNYYDLSNMPTPTVGGSSTGVTTIVNADGTTNNGHVKSWYYVVGSTGDLTVAVTETGTADEEKAIIGYVLSGVDTTTPIDTSAGATDAPGDTSIAAPSVSPTSSDAFLICHASSGPENWGASTHPGGMTETYEAVFGGFLSHTGATLQLSASGSTGAKTFTVTNITGGTSVMLSIAVLTATVGPTNDPNQWVPQPFAGPVPRLFRTGIRAPFQLLGDQTVAAAPTPITLTDTAVAADALSTSAAAPLTDTAAGADALALAATLALADTAAAADALSLTAAVPLTDTASAADSLSISAAVALTDTASAADLMAAGVPISLADTASASDALTLAAAAPLADTASASDALASSATLALADTASASDALSVDTGGGGGGGPVAISSVTLGAVAFPTTTATVTTSESPAATQVGDLVIVINSGDWDVLSDMQTPVATGSPTMNTISGGTADGGTNLAHIKSYWYLANTGGAQTITAAYTGDGFSDKALAAYVLTGADTADPIDIAGATTSGATPEDPWVLASVSPTTSDAFLIAHLLRGSNAATDPGGIGTPGSMTERYDQGTTAPNAVGATEQLSASGATGTRSFDAGVAPKAWSGVLIAVKTAEGGAAVIDEDQAPQQLASMFLNPNRASFQLAGDTTAVVSTTPTLSDTATATDALSITVAVPLTDTASAAEALAAGVPISLTDTASASDSLALAAAVPLAEVASAADVLAITVALALADTAAASESLTAGVPISLADTAAAVDALSVSISGANVTLTETASASDALSITVALALADTASATESISIPEAPVQTVVSRITTGASMFRGSTGTDARRVSSGAQMSRAGTGTDARRTSTGHQMSRIVSSQEE